MLGENSCLTTEFHSGIMSLKGAADTMEFNDILKGLRLSKEMHQYEVADALGIDVSRYGKWEHGKAIPDLRLLVSIAKLYDVTTDFLLGLASPKDYEFLREKKEVPKKRSSVNRAVLDEIQGMLRDFEPRIRSIIQEEIAKGQDQNEPGEPGSKV